MFASRVSLYHYALYRIARRADFVSSYLTTSFQIIGLYYLLSKLTVVYGRRYSVIAPTTNWWLLTSAGVVAIALLAGGAGNYVSYSYSYYVGAWVILAGLIVQVIAITLFIIFLSIFTQRVRTAKWLTPAPEWHHIRSRRFFPFFLPAIFVAVVVIYMRTIASIVVLFTGWSSGSFYLAGVLSLVFDTMLLVIPSFVLTVVHPGTCLGRNPIPVSQGMQRDVTTGNGLSPVENGYDKATGQPHEDILYDEPQPVRNGPTLA